MIVPLERVRETLYGNRAPQFIPKRHDMGDLLRNERQVSRKVKHADGINDFSDMLEMENIQNWLSMIWNLLRP